MPTLESVARQVGYASGFSFSAAFKRRFGTSPRDFRSRSDLWTNTPSYPQIS
ncbi:MAG: AraC family transcriptional regulator [Micropruina sp.]|uniref:AraC family transcriptional regulator n=1 Tax=Micropruina sp. TaxID=2737536 RepID=UPI0039E468E7